MFPRNAAPDTETTVARRDLLRKGLASTLAWSISNMALPRSARATTVAGVSNEPILKAHLGEPIRCPNSHGDVWTTTWADDDTLYSVADDTTGFNHACNSNLAIHQITGGPPPNIQGVTVNPMSEFGKAGELKQDRASWKASGLTCVDGVLYLAVSRHYYDGVGETGEGSAHRFWIQETWDASIIKSTDHGKTWSATPQLGHAMFPGRIFSNPFIVQYGKDGRGTKHDADKFVYAVSNDGTWNNGNWMTLGRVRRDRIGLLNAADWEFVHGVDKEQQPLWAPRHDNALYTFRSPGRASMTGIHHIAPLDLYIMPQWHYSHLEDPKRRWRVTRWEMYYSRAPWGPWVLFHTQDFEPQSFYNPSIPSKFISQDGRRFWIFVAGDFTSHKEPENVYCLNTIPVTLDLEGA